jgi:signal transduction histidine kinase
MKRVFLLISSISLVIWALSLFFCFKPYFLSSKEWAKINFAFSFFSFVFLLLLIFSLARDLEKKLKGWLIGFLVFTFFVFLLVYLKFSFLSFFSILAISIFLIFLFWILIFISGFYLKFLINFKIFYSLILFGIFLLFNVSFYFFFPKDFLENYLFLGPAFSIFLIFSQLLIVLTPIFEIRMVLSEIFILSILGGLAFLFFAIPEFYLKTITGLIFLLFLVFSFYFLRILREESKSRKEIERLLIEERNLARAKDQFILSIQHHLRTPLGPVRGYLERIISGTYGREENPVIKEKLIEIKKLVDQLYSLIEKLLDIQMLRVGKEILNLEECQIEDLIESVVEEMLPYIKEKGLYLKYQKVSLPKIKVDKKRIREAIWNLIDNAIKYTRRGGITITTKVEGGKLKIGIADTGIGMEKEEIEYFLAGKFFERGEEAKKMYGPGRGIGLVLALEFVKAHDGRILAESEGFGKGSVFWIELPLKT